jgi:lysophospholipase L1-like esterase
MRIALAGDLAMTEKSGWGGAFKQLLNDDLECINMSRSGCSSKTFGAEGCWKKCLESKPDFVLIEFGHNDQPGKRPDRETDPKTFLQNMSRFVDESRAAGVKPVLVTSMARRQFGPDGKIHSTLEPYADAVKSVATDKQVPLIDLHARSIELYEKLGPEGCKDLSPKKPDGTYDSTHLNAEGSETIAALVAEELKKVAPELVSIFK